MVPKKIGIITIHKVNNYGAELQAFALQEKLTHLGFTAEVIDYLYYKHQDFQYSKQARPFVALDYRIKFKEWLNPIISHIKSIPYKGTQNIRNSKFDEFRNKHTKYSAETLNSIEALYHEKLPYDVYMTGSDQVWNPYTNVSLKPYFLDFAQADRRKISYASSFGVSTIPDDAKPIYRDLLNRFDRIAVREEQGVKLVKELTGRDACHVLDPTLLMDEQDWRKVAITSDRTKPYILLYVLTHSPYITNLAKKMAADLGWDLVRICKNSAVEDKDGTITNIIDAGPAEYLGLFLNASFVLTNSFHGTAFSVNFRKPFYTILPQHKPNNSRQEGLLSSMGLKKRIIHEGARFPRSIDYFPDFTEAISQLKIQREHSIHYLKDAINYR